MNGALTIVAVLCVVFGMAALIYLAATGNGWGCE